MLSMRRGWLIERNVPVGFWLNVVSTRQDDEEEGLEKIVMALRDGGGE